MVGGEGAGHAASVHRKHDSVLMPARNACKKTLTDKPCRPIVDRNNLHPLPCCRVVALRRCRLVAVRRCDFTAPALRDDGDFAVSLVKGHHPGPFPLPGRLGKETCFILPDKNALGKGWGLGGKGNPASVGGGFSLPSKEYVHSRLVVTWRRHWGRRAACLPGCSRRCASGFRA